MKAEKFHQYVQQPHQEEFLTPSEAADVLRLPVQTLANWRHTGKVKLPFKKIGRAVRYSRSELMEFMGQPTK